MNLTQTNPWLLPEGIEEMLPGKADLLEHSRRELIDLFAAHGFQLVMPPFIEYLDSLLIGVGKDLELQTFTLTDQLSGRLMGIRADMTPQVSRMDAHHLNHQQINRLCYLGTVLRARPERLGGTRAPLQFGAEIYGHDGVESDAEIIELMINSMMLVGAKNLTLDLGNVQVFNAMIEALQLNTIDRNRLLDTVVRKSLPDLQALLAEWEITGSLSSNLQALLTFTGNETSIGKFGDSLKDAPEAVLDGVKRVEALVSLLKSSLPNCKLHIDFSDLCGYQYQTGIVFSVFADGIGQELARGGRYNDIGAAFGEGRPATGFSADLKQLIDLFGTDDVVGRKQTVAAPWSSDKALQIKIEDLRTQGYAVAKILPGTEAGIDIDFLLVESSTGWELEARK